MADDDTGVAAAAAAAAAVPHAPPLVSAYKVCVPRRCNSVDEVRGALQGGGGGGGGDPAWSSWALRGAPALLVCRAADAPAHAVWLRGAAGDADTHRVERALRFVLHWPAAANDEAVYADTVLAGVLVAGVQPLAADTRDAREMARREALGQVSSTDHNDDDDDERAAESSVGQVLAAAAAQHAVPVFFVEDALLVRGARYAQQPLVNRLAAAAALFVDAQRPAAAQHCAVQPALRVRYKRHMAPGQGADVPLRDVPPDLLGCPLRAGVRLAPAAGVYGAAAPLLVYADVLRAATAADAAGAV